MPERRRQIVRPSREATSSERPQAQRSDVMVSVEMTAAREQPQARRDMTEESRQWQESWQDGLSQAPARVGKAGNPANPFQTDPGTPWKGACVLMPNDQIEAFAYDDVDHVLVCVNTDDVWVLQIDGFYWKTVASFKVPVPGFEATSVSVYESTLLVGGATEVVVWPNWRDRTEWYELDGPPAVDVLVSGTASDTNPDWPDQVTASYQTEPVPPGEFLGRYADLPTAIDDGTIGDWYRNSTSDDWRQITGISPNTNNLIRDSQDFDTAQWVKSAVTIVDSGDTAPDGSIAWKLDADGTTNEHSLDANAVAWLEDVTQAFTVWVKAAEEETITLQLAEVLGTDASVDINLRTQTVSNVTVGASWTAVTGAVEGVGGGWLAATIYGTQSSFTNVQGKLFLRSNAPYAGSGGVFVWRTAVTPADTSAQPVASYNFNEPRIVLVDEDWETGSTLAFDEQFDNPSGEVLLDDQFDREDLAPWTDESQGQGVAGIDSDELLLLAFPAAAAAYLRLENATPGVEVTLELERVQSSGFVFLIAVGNAGFFSDQYVFDVPAGNTGPVSFTFTPTDNIIDISLAADGAGATVTIPFVKVSSGDGSPEGWTVVNGNAVLESGDVLNWQPTSGSLSRVWRDVDLDDGKDYVLRCGIGTGGTGSSRAEVYEAGGTSSGQRLAQTAFTNTAGVYEDDFVGQDTVDVWCNTTPDFARGFYEFIQIIEKGLPAGWTAGVGDQLQAYSIGGVLYCPQGANAGIRGRAVYVIPTVPGVPIEIAFDNVGSVNGSISIVNDGTFTPTVPPGTFRRSLVPIGNTVEIRLQCAVNDSVAEFGPITVDRVEALKEWRTNTLQDNSDYPLQQIDNALVIDDEGGLFGAGAPAPVNTGEPYIMRVNHNDATTADTRVLRVTRNTAFNDVIAEVTTTTTGVFDVEFVPDVSPVYLAVWLPSGTTGSLTFDEFTVAVPVLPELPEYSRTLGDDADAAITRAGSANFPRKFGCIVRAEALEIFDATQGAPQLWMTFENTTTRSLLSASPSGFSAASAIAYAEGRMYVSQDTDQFRGALAIVDFVSDSGENFYEQADPHIAFGGNIAQRNQDLPPSVIADGAALVNYTARDVAAVVLPGAPDAPGGLKEPTWAVATAGGVSVRVTTGDVWDITSSAYPQSHYVDLTDDGLVGFCNDFGSLEPRFSWCVPVPDKDRNVFDSFNDPADKLLSYVDAVTRTPPYAHTERQQNVTYMGGNMWALSSNGPSRRGLTIFEYSGEGVSLTADDLFTHLTDTYNTGPMTNPAGAWLLDSNMGGTGPDNSLNANDIGFGGVGPFTRVTFNTCTTGICVPDGDLMVVSRSATDDLSGWYARSRPRDPWQYFASLSELPDDLYNASPTNVQLTNGCFAALNLNGLVNPGPDTGTQLRTENLPLLITTEAGDVLVTE